MSHSRLSVYFYDFFRFAGWLLLSSLQISSHTFSSSDASVWGSQRQVSRPHCQTEYLRFSLQDDNTDFQKMTESCTRVQKPPRHLLKVLQQAKVDLQSNCYFQRQRMHPRNNSDDVKKPPNIHRCNRKMAPKRLNNEHKPHKKPKKWP